MEKDQEMRVRIIKDPDTKIAVVGGFDKSFRNDKYELLFNTKTGVEVLYGIDDNPDPFVLELPSMIDCGIMGHCLNKCSFCYQGDNNEPNMKLEDYKKIIDETKHHVNQIALGGRGDPNLHENFREIVEYSKNNNVVPNYTTSGINLTNEQVEISKMCGAVAVSDYVRSYTYKSLKMFMDAGIKTNIHFIYSTQSHDSAIEILKGKDIWNGDVDFERLNAVVFLLFKPQGSGKSLGRWVPSYPMFKEFSANLKNQNLKFKIGMDSCMINHVASVANFSEVEQMAIDFCESSRMSVYITPDMRLVPCSFADHDEYGESIRDKTIYEVWNNSESFRLFRKKLEIKPDRCPLNL